ncbi:unnamed protein product [Kuraishia capsulata CBS 1993]|uniref:Uncharacterized protein n=1 Tax=Kuraishia capsulata CBS 1993 TaxID=1382522 RepID=W6MXH4_9ASCO|nr:uncharacterized protein KUCA_T00004880001 [Kuraishia capsulata CBS 1993]CDK28895.1 unnamed protein product [Kuraishia capsulata CBS 1993]
MQKAAKAQIRSAVELAKDPENPDRSTEDRIKHLRDVSEFLRRNIVQGEKTADDKYQLHIHKDTELGDNEDIKKTKNTLTNEAAASGGCCGGGDVTLKEKRA